MSIENDKPIPDANSGLSANPPENEQELLLHRYLDGRLDEQERAAVDKWLKTSAAARRSLDALREEERLLRDALESRVEPSKRLADKILANLHNEERVRLHVIRGRRLRRQIFAVMGVAASIIMCLWLVKPREAAGNFMSGTPATLVTTTGVQVFTKNTSIYDGDTLVTRQGQFVRVRLNNGATLDVDELSRVRLEKAPTLTLRLEEGRIGLNTDLAKSEITVNLAQGSVRAFTDALLDVWLPQPAEAAYPAVLAGPQKSAVVAADAAERPAVVTTLKGMTYITSPQYPDGYSLAANVRAIFTQQSRLVKPVNAAASRVLESRADESWHALDNVPPPGRSLMGFIEPPEFLELGRRLGLAQKLPAIEEALKELQQAMQSADVRERAEKLAAGQNALRAASAALNQEDENRRFGRMVEGLAHVQRGLANLASNRGAAHDAFAAASIAFEEAQQPIVPAGLPAPKEKPKPTWPASVKSAAAPVLAELTPAEQSELLATYYHAVSEYWRARTDSTNLVFAQERASDAAGEFAQLSRALGASVEACAARVGEALCWQFANRDDKAASLLQQAVALPLAGSAPAARKWSEGLRQHALLNLVRLHVAAAELDKAAIAAEDFSILYPLETETPLAREIQRALEGEKLKAAERALQDKHYALAADRFAELLLTSRQPELQTDLRLNLVRALIGLQHGDRARAELEKLAPTLPATRRAEFESLSNEVKALPSAPPPTRAQLGLPEAK